MCLFLYCINYKMNFYAEACRTEPTSKTTILIPLYNLVMVVFCESFLSDQQR